MQGKENLKDDLWRNLSMNYNFKTYPLFDKEVKRLAKKYHSLKNDLQKFISDLRENPELGSDLGHGLHKIRMSISSKGKGKSGGARVLTLTIDLDENEKEIGLHYIYDKSERETLKDNEIEQILKRNGMIE